MARYSTLSERDASWIGRAFGVDVASVSPMHGGTANSSFILGDAHGAQWLATVLDNHDQDSAAMLVMVTEFVRAHGVAVPRFIPALDGQWYVMWRDLPVVLKAFEAGSTLADGVDYRAAAIGRLLAQIHAISSPPDIGRRGRRIPYDRVWSMEDRLPDELRRAVDRASSIESTLELDAGPMVLVHGDLFLDNLLAAGDGRLVALDWETASLDAGLLDLGITMTSLAVREGGFLCGTAEQLIAGYASDGSRSSIGLDTLRQSFVYAATMLAFHRFFRHVVRFPDPARENSYRELLLLAEHTL